MIKPDSFTAQILAEIAHIPLRKPCCRKALVAGVLCTADVNDEYVVVNRLVAARTILGSLHTDGIDAHVELLPRARNHQYLVMVPGIRRYIESITDNICCQKTSLRGAFLAGGSAAQPDKTPHLEILCRNQTSAKYLQAMSLAFDCELKSISRRGRIVVNARSAAAVGSLLSAIGGHSSRLAFEQGRVIGEMRASINREINAEAANLKRSALASWQQIRAGEVIQATLYGWQALPSIVKEAALLRQTHPADSLQELATRAQCSRAAMARRLRRLVKIAQTSPF